MSPAPTPIRDDVTVVIPTHDRWRMLRTALWSVLCQEGGAPRVVIVDDGSTDETPSRLAAIDHPAVRVRRHEEAQGVSRARNDGLEDVDTPWVCFLDDDDVWAPDHLARAMAAAQSAPGIDVVCSGSVTTDVARQVIKLRPPPPADELPRTLAFRNDLGTPSRVLLRTAAVRAAGGFDEQLSITADWDLWLRLVHPGAIAVAGELTVGYTEHGENMHLAADHALREMPRLEARHERAANVRLTDRAAGWVAASYRRSGRRVLASRWYLKSWRRGGGRRELGRAIGVLLGERAIRRSGLQRPEVIPAGVADWLEDARAIDGLPLDELALGRGCAER